MKNKISKLVALQYSLNSAIDPDWISKAITEEYDYRTAASQEIAEAMESLGYAWWTNRPLDMQNVLTELVDAMHFLLSLNISQVDALCSNPEEVCVVLGERIAKRFAPADNKQNTLVAVRKAIRELQSQINTGEIGNIWIAFFKVTQSLKFEVDHIYSRYLAKNILNTFRQQNGYKTGQYQKIWDDGQQDNSHVSNYVDANYVDANSSKDFDSEAFLSWLQDTYKQKTKNVAAASNTESDPLPVATNTQVSSKNQGIILGNKRK